ncbi:MAG TPA: anti-sigma factor [Micromonosporaceae bacterium]
METDHVRNCAACRAELDQLTDLVAVGRETDQVRDLPAPPARVWEMVLAGTGIAPAHAASDVTAPVQLIESTVDQREAGTTGQVRALDRTGRSTTVRRRGAREGRRSWPAWARTAAIATAAAAVAVVGTIGAGHVSERINRPEVTAQTNLAAYGATPPEAHGLARILVKDGSTQLHIHVADLPKENGYYEVWLIDPTTSQMVSVGVLGGQSDVILPLPSSVDLHAYRLVDVSAEPWDGDPAHSGDSLLRGTLPV